MLLNNLHALRVHTQGIFEDMGGEQVKRMLVELVPSSSLCLHFSYIYMYM